MNTKETILKLLKTDLKWCAIKMCKGNIYDADDLLQDLALSVFENLSVYINRTEAHVKNLLIQKIWWIKGCNAQYTNAKKRQPVEYRPSIVENDAWGLLQKHELHKALLQLSKKQSVCFRLKLEGYKRYEIAEILNIPDPTAKTRMIVGLKKLKQLLAA